MAAYDLVVAGAIYGDQVAILSIKKNFFAVPMENKEVADTFRSLLAIAWKIAA